MNRWVLIMADYSVKFDFFISAVYFNSFHFLVIIILLSLLRGLIWEVFTVIDSLVKPEAITNQKFQLFFTKVTTNQKDQENKASMQSEKKSVTLIKKNSKGNNSVIINSNIEKLHDEKTSEHYNNDLPMILEKSISNSSGNDNNDEFYQRKNIEHKDSSVIKTNIFNENLNEDSFENSIQIFKVQTKLLSSIYIYNENIQKDTPFVIYNNSKRHENFKYTESKSNDIVVKNQSNEFTSLVHSDSSHQYGLEKNELKDHKNDEIELISRNMKENLKIFTGNSIESASLKNKTMETRNFNEREKKTINFYKKKIKHLKYFLHLQERKKKTDLDKYKFDENSHFFDGKDSESMRALEEFLLSNLEDENMTDYFLPDKADSLLESQRSHKTDKKKQGGVNYGNSKDFLLKKAFLKDFNMEQIKVKFFFIIL